MCLETYRVVCLIHCLHPKGELTPDALFCAAAFNYYLMLSPLRMLQILEHALYVIHMAIEETDVITDGKNVF